MCNKCDKGFKRDPQTQELRRCMYCNPVLYSFDILFKPEETMKPEETILCLSEVMAEHLNTVVRVSDYQQKLERF